MKFLKIHCYNGRDAFLNASKIQAIEPAADMQKPPEQDAHAIDIILESEVIFCVVGHGANPSEAAENVAAMVTEHTVEAFCEFRRNTQPPVAVPCDLPRL